MTLASNASGALGDGNHPYNGAAIPPGYTTQLGWVSFNNPQGCDIDGYNQYIKGTTAANPVPQFSWYQDYYGTLKTWDTNKQQWTTVTITQQNPNHDITGQYLHADNLDFWDCPGWPVTATNDYGIAGGVGEIIQDFTYVTWVQNSGVRASNKFPWTTSFDIKAVNGKWSVVSHNP